MLKLSALIATCVLIAGFTGCSDRQPTITDADSTSGKVLVSHGLVIGVTPVAPSQMVELLPQVETQPVMLAFKSKYCHDCQEMAPHLAALKEANPDVSFVDVDVQYDKDKYGHLIDAFSPSTVPVVISIAEGGGIDQSKIGYQSLEDLSAQLLKVTDI